jgi:hypothetical protein
MSEAKKTSVIHSVADDSRIWYPLHPRWIPLLRLFGILGLLFAIYSVVLQQPWSFPSLSRWSVPAILVLSCLFIRPELRTPTVLNRIGSIAHLLLIFLALPLALLALILYWLHA